MITASILPFLLAVLMAILLVAWVRADFRRAGYLLTGLVSAVAFAHFWFPGFMEPGREIVILQAGLSQLNIHHVFGIGNHFCVTCDQASELMNMAGVDRLPLESQVLLNRFMYVVSVGALAVTGMVLTGSLILTIFFCAGFVGIPVVAVQGYTDYPSAFIQVLFFAGLLSAAVFREKRGRVLSVVAIAAIVVATILAFLTRPETASIGLAALVALILERPRPKKYLKKLWHVIGSVLRLPAAGGLPDTRVTSLVRPNWFVASFVALVVMVAMIVVSGRLAGGTFPVWLIDGVNPLDPSTVTAFFHLVALLPLSMVLLALAGMYKMARRPLVFMLLPFSMVFMLKTYSSAARFDLHTMFRMFSLLAPMFLVFAMWGLRDFAGFVRRTVPDVRVRLLIAAVLIASYSVNTPFVRKAARTKMPPEGYITKYEKPKTWLSMNPQLETRFLLDMIDSHPDCLFRTRVIDNESYADVAAGRSEGDFKEMWFSRDGILPGPPEKMPGCVLFYRSLDCNLRDRDICESEFAGTEAVREISFSSRPYGDYLLVRYEQPIVLGVYRQN